MAASVLDASGKTTHSADWRFAVTADRQKRNAFPDAGVPITVHEQDEMPDGVWPVSTGVPLPLAAVYDIGELGLFENGERVPANLVPRATWLPSSAPGAKDEKTDSGGVRWAGLSFVAKYDNGKPRQYVLRRLPKDAPPLKSPLAVSEDASAVVIRTGPAQLVVSKTSFDGVHGAWLDSNGNGQFEPGEQLLLAGGGPCIVDDKDKRYEARHRARSGDTNVRVTIEEAGPACVVVAAKGWYHTDAGEPLCIYHTRIVAYAGLPFFWVKHRTIISYDTRTRRLADSAFALRTPPAVWGYFGADRVLEPAKPQPDAPYWSSSLHQDRHNHFRLLHERMGVQEGRRAVVTEVGNEGVRSNGSIVLYTTRDYRGVFVTLKDAWQKFPKELEVSSQGIALHFWPFHGEDTFSDAEELSRENVHKLYWAHEGKFLDLQIPAKYRERLHEICKTDWFGLGESVEVGYGSNGIGAAISNEFVVHLNDPTSKLKAPSPGLVQQDPHAFADPAYACSTDALEKVHPVDGERFGPLEQLIEKGYLAATRFFSNTNEWGMWNYADLHTYPKPFFGYPNLHRVWLASHYRNVQTAWLMYFRSGSPDWLAWARAYGDHFMNVDVCHYDDPANPVIGTDPEGKRKRGYVIKMAGAMMHCKGFAHWGSDLNVAAHHIDPDAFLWSYYLTGDYAARDAYELWASAFDRVPVPYAADRETNNTLGALLALYRHSWDPQLLLHVHRMGDVLVGVPFAAHGSGCMWNVFWLDRYYGLTRDDRAIERVKEFLAPGPNSPRNGLVYATFSALCYDLTGDRSYISAAVESAWRVAHAIYLNPADPYDGLPQMRYLATENFAYTAAPRWMRAMAEAGIPFRLERETCTVPWGGPGFADPAGGRANLEVLFLADKPEDSAIALEYGSAHPAEFRVFDAAGKRIAERKMAGGSFYGEKAAKLEVPKERAPGLLCLAGTVYAINLTMPISRFPGEAAVLRPDGRYSIAGMFYYLAPSPGYEGQTALEVGGPTNYWGEGPTLVQVTGAGGETLLDTSIAGDLQRHTVRLVLDPKKTPPPWKLFVAANVGFRFTGPEKLYAAPDRSRLEAILKALPSGPKAP
jgi:hypothetical protein